MLIWCSFGQGNAGKQRADDGALLGCLGPKRRPSGPASDVEGALVLLRVVQGVGLP